MCLLRYSSNSTWATIYCWNIITMFTCFSMYILHSSDLQYSLKSSTNVGLVSVDGRLTRNDDMPSSSLYLSTMALARGIMYAKVSSLPVWRKQEIEVSIQLILFGFICNKRQKSLQVIINEWWVTNYRLCKQRPMHQNLLSRHEASIVTWLYNTCYSNNCSIGNIHR